VLKTHQCGEITKNDIGQTVTLAGWVDRRRDHGGLIFIDLRDRSGLVQVVYNPETGAEAHRVANDFRGEYVVQVTGEVSPRPEGTVNEKLPTGYVEVVASETSVLNASQTPPFYINKEADVDENVRLRYRYLDLRRRPMLEKMMLRYRMTKFMRDFLDRQGFLEIETPILIKSTPEGARDYLVPSRVQPGKFYALPQSPQQIKQMLMVAGVEKYYQLARCFRDEDLRADRQPEFTQLDLEMSFIEESDILDMMEELLTALTRELRPDATLVTPFPRIPYAEAMARYGSDKPDLRYGLEIGDVGEIAARSDFGVFKQVIEAGGVVKGIVAPGCAAYTRGQQDELRDIAIAHGAKGIVTFGLGEPDTDLGELTMETVRSQVARFFNVELVREMAQRLEAKSGDLLLLVADRDLPACEALGALRLEVAARLKLAPPDVFSYAFVVDFPLLFKDGQSGHYQPMHHPFTAPRVADEGLLDTDPEKVGGRHYDIVCNGYEIAGGSIRIHRADMQRRVFQLLGYSDTEIDDRFGPLLEAFTYGAPPHGGLAAGIDRMAMILTGADTIREVIAFPKTQGATDLTLESPSGVSAEQLHELHLRLEDVEPE